jgi:cell division protein FtsL
MVITEKENVIYGNTVLAPQFEPLRKRENKEYDDLNKAKKEMLKNMKNKRFKSKLYTMRNISVIFIIGLAIVFRYSMIYNYENKLNNVRIEEKKITAENEQLKLDLVKMNNLSNIEEIAVNQLHMVRPDKSEVVFMDLSKDNFAAYKSDSQNNTQKSFVDYLKKILF